MRDVIKNVTEDDLERSQKCLNGWRRMKLYFL